MDLILGGEGELTAPLLGGAGLEPVILVLFNLVGVGQKPALIFCGATSSTLPGPTR